LLALLPTLAFSPAGFGWHNAPGIYDDVMCAAWKDIVDAVHAKGSVIYLQLWHMGRQVFFIFCFDKFLSYIVARFPLPLVSSVILASVFTLYFIPSSHIFQGHSSFAGEDNVVSASALKLDGSLTHANGEKGDYDTPRAVLLEEFPALVEEYRVAAEYCKKAGFDGVEVHAGNGAFFAHSNTHCHFFLLNCFTHF
jgi:N-ethylmaleimide reductase